MDPTTTATSSPPGPPPPQPASAPDPDARRLPPGSRVRRGAPWLLFGLGLLLLLSLLRLGLWDPWETNRLGPPDGGSPSAAASLPGTPGARPPLGQWLAQGAVAAFGTHEAALRLPGLLGGLILLGTLLVVARRRWGADAGLVGAGLLLVSPHFLLQAGLALGEMTAIASQGVLILLLLELLHPVPAPGRAPAWRHLGLGGGVAVAGVFLLLGGGLLGVLFPLLLFGCWWGLAPRQRSRAGAALFLLLLSLLGGLLPLLAPGPLAALWPTPAKLLLTTTTFELLGYHLVFGLFPLVLLLPAAAVVLARQAVLPEPAAASPAPAAPAPAVVADTPFLFLWFGLGLVWSTLGSRMGEPLLFIALPAAAALVAAATGARPGAPPLPGLFAVSLLLVTWMVGDGLAQHPAAVLTPLLGDSADKLPAGLRLPAGARSLALLFAGALCLWALQPAAWLTRLRDRLAARRVLARGLTGLAAATHRLQTRQTAWLLAGLAALGLAGLLALVTLPRLTHTLSPKGLLDTWRQASRGETPLLLHGVAAGQADFYLAGLPRITSRTELLAGLGAKSPAYALVPRDRLAELDGAYRGSRGEHLRVLDDRSSKLLLVANWLPPDLEDRNPLVGLIHRDAPQPRLPVGARLDDSLELLGVDLSQDSVAVGGTFVLTTYYRVLRAPTRSWKVFLHVETPSHRIDTGSTDHQPAGGILPTNTWRQGDVVQDRFVVKIPFFSPVGTYSLRSGLFIGDERMKVAPPDKHDGKNRILLGQVRVRAL